MNKEDAVTLQELPEVARVFRHAVQPGDVIVLECDHSISMDTAERIKRYAEMVWPDHKIAVLGDGVKIKVVADCKCQHS